MREHKFNTSIAYKLVFICVLIVMPALHVKTSALCHAELIDGIVAYVDDQAITYSEFRERYTKMKKLVPSMTEEEALNSMINTLLLFDQARKMKLEATSDDDLVKEYIDIKIKSRVFIKEEALMEYYNKNKSEFGGKDYISVREEIEKYLTEKETNRKLKEHIEELRHQSNIVVQLRDR